ncbi:MAG: hypothetical protein HKN24_04005 [Acidimicrobiales bacterium]|nr:hypothetical protein [Acidimicrobiales bacterium]
MTTSADDTAIRTAALENGRRLVIRVGTLDDVEGLDALYHRLSIEDLQRRFFSGAFPPRAAVEAWADVADRKDGLLLVVDDVAADGTSTIVAEAGFAPMSDGDAELGITVDRASRGWLGPWLLDALLEQAAARGIPNLQALTATRNRQMRLMLCGRGAAGLPDDDWTSVRLTVSTTGSVPTWHATSPGRKRLLVETGSYQWTGTAEANRRGFDVMVCAGPSASRHDCPVVEGGHCPLVDGADGVLFALREDDEVLSAHHERTSGPPTFTRLEGETIAETLGRVQAGLDGDEEPPCG